MRSRRACIDIGSNTTRLLVADLLPDAELRYVHQERAFTRIGRSVRLHGSIPQAKIAEVVTVVSEQRKRARELGAVSVRALATAAIRRASNGGELARAIGDATSLDVEVLSPQDEARLAFLGACAPLRDGEEELGVVDVGGASSELVVGLPPDRMRWWASLPVGSGDLADECMRHDPPSTADVDCARRAVARALQKLAVPQPSRTVAVGGSAGSMARLVGPLLDERAFARSIEVLCGGNAEQVAHNYQLDPERVRLLPAGLVILEEVARSFGTPLVIGRGGVREGALLESAL